MTTTLPKSNLSVSNFPSLPPLPPVPGNLTSLSNYSLSGSAYRLIISNSARINMKRLFLFLRKLVFLINIFERKRSGVILS